MTNQEFIESIRLENEEWRPVVGYEDCYMVSNIGRIVVLGRLVKRKHRTGKDANYFMKPHLCSTSIAPSTPYRRMTFVRNGKKDTRLLHRIIAEAFLPNPNNLPCVDHIDDNPENSVASNLQWCSYKDNNSKEHHRIAASKSKIGTAAHNRKAVAQITMDGEIVKIFPSMTHAESEGFSHSAIFRVIHNKLKSHGGFKWMYLTAYEKTLINQDVNELSPMQ